MKNICLVTGSRAEYGIMKQLMKKIDNDVELNIEIIATAMHLEEKYGNTYEEIEKDGFQIYKKIPLNLIDTTKKTIIKAISILSIELSRLFEERKYDLVIILGDRYEMLAVANTALIYNLPICHLHGGEKTLGNFDEYIRHAITKMSHLHLTSADEYRNRVIQLGETPDTVFNTGSLGVENVLTTSLFDRTYLENTLNISLSSDYYVVLFHPVTLDNENEAEIQTANLLTALEEIDAQFIFIGSNSDAGSDKIMDKIMGFVEKNKKAKLYKSLSSTEYHSLLKNSQGLIGNSSSGLIEVPSLKVPTLNIGDRQKERIHGPSVIDVKAETNEILSGMMQMKTITDFSNPYEKNNSSQMAHQIIKSALSQGITLKKDFFDVEIGVEV